MYKLYYGEQKERLSTTHCYFFRDNSSLYKHVETVIIKGVDYKNGNFAIYKTVEDSRVNQPYYNYSNLKYKEMSYNEVLYFSRYLSTTCMPVNVYKQLREYIDILLVNWDVS